MVNRDLDDCHIIQLLESHFKKFFAMHEQEVPDSGLYNRIISDVEKVLIQTTIDHVDYVQIKAARILGINRNTLRKKIKALKIKVQ